MRARTRAVLLAAPTLLGVALVAFDGRQRAVGQPAPSADPELAWRLRDLERRVAATPPEPRSTVAPISGREVTRGVATKFLQLVGEDLAHGEARRAEGELNSLERLVERLERPPTSQEKAQSAWLTFTNEKRRSIDVRDGALVVRDAAGRSRPVFLSGYGVFQRVRDDVGVLPSVGANLVQIEVGPDHVMRRGGVVAPGHLRDLTSVLDRAARAGVAVDLLISPHYFPRWALEDLPALAKHGSFGFCIHHPAAADLLRRYVKAVLAPIKNHPALMSVCLSNEPKLTEEPCEPAAHAWETWLAARHGSVQGYNAAHSTSARSLADIPLPDPTAGPSGDPALWLDFVRFNQEQFAAWHQMLADAVHEVAPGLPVHSKMMALDLLGVVPGRTTVPSAGIDATLAARFSTLSGNDGANRFSHSETEFAQGWRENAMVLDLQRSLSSAPIFNSEDHPIDDRDERPIPPEHLRATLWQAAVHGQAATTIWIWDRSFDRKSDFWASILERPEAVESVGLTNIDMNRAAAELRALQDAPADVAILHSVSALVWDPQVWRQTEALYTALSFTGVKIGFVTERQLEEGYHPGAGLLFVPGNQHLSPVALRTLSSYRGRVVFVGGRELLGRGDHGQPASLELRADVVGDGHGSSWRRLWAELDRALSAWGVKRPPIARDVAGRPLWGVEWRSVRAPNAPSSWVVNLCNYRRQAVTVELIRGDRPVGGTDVLSGARFPHQLELKSLETKLVRVGARI